MRQIRPFILIVTAITAGIFAAQPVSAEPVGNPDELKIRELNEGAVTAAESRIQAQNLVEQREGVQELDFDSVKVGDIDPISGGTVIEVNHESYEGNRDSVKILAVDSQTGREVIIQRWDASIPATGWGFATAEYVLDKKTGNPVWWTSHYYYNGQKVYTELGESFPPVLFPTDPFNPESHLQSKGSGEIRKRFFNSDGKLFRTVVSNNYQSEGFRADEPGWSSADFSIFDGDGNLLGKRTEISLFNGYLPGTFDLHPVSKRILNYNSNGEFTGSVVKTFSYSSITKELVSTNIKEFDPLGNFVSEKDVKGRNSEFDFFSLVSIAENFGEFARVDTDINGDGNTDILDLVEAARQFQF